MTSIQSQIQAAPSTKGNADRTPCSFNRMIASDPIQMEIEFGMPSKDCQNLGICRITMPFVIPEKLKQQCNCRHKACGTIHQNRVGNLVFRFPKKQIRPKILATQFADDQFTVLEHYVLPEPLQRLFYPRIFIEKGVYSVKEIDNHLVIEM